MEPGNPARARYLPGGGPGRMGPHYPLAQLLALGVCTPFLCFRTFQSMEGDEEKQ